MNEEDLEEFPLGYALDNAILMHRDIHFGGNFDIMLEYYGGEGKGISSEIELTHIQELYAVEKKSGKNLSGVVLSGAEAEVVAKGKNAYKKLRQLCEVENPKNPVPKLVANLILADTEEEEKSALEAIIAQKSAAVPALIDLLRNEDYYSALYPGYGNAPVLAAAALGKIGDKRAIISLFEAVGEGDFFNEDTILDALHGIGEPARDFLLRVLQGRPLTIDNEKAAIALVRFKEDSLVSKACLQMLDTLDLKKEEALATYLALACEGLPASDLVKLKEIGSRETTPKALNKDISIMIKNIER